MTRGQRIGVGLGLLLAFAPCMAFAGIRLDDTSSGSSGATAGQDIDADDGVFKTLRATSTTHGLTVDAASTFKGSSVTVNGSLLVLSSADVRGTLALTSGQAITGATTFQSSMTIINSNGFLMKGAHGLVPGSGDMRLEDTTGVGLGVGPGLRFTFVYDAAGNIVHGAEIRGIKYNSTDADYGGAIQLNTRANGSGDLAEAGRILPGGGAQFGAGATVSTFSATGALTMAGGANIIGTSSITTTGSMVQGGSKSCATGVVTDADGKFDGCVASDFSLKTSIKNLTYKPGLIDALKPVSYRWKPSARRDDKEHIGFIAQDVEAVSPASVLPAGVNLKGLDSNALLALAIKEIQDLRKRVKALEKK